MEENFGTTIDHVEGSLPIPECNLEGVWHLLDGLRACTAQLEACMALGDLDGLAERMAHRQQLLMDWMDRSSNPKDLTERQDEVVQHLEEVAAADARLRAALMAWREAVWARIKDLDRGERLLKEYGGTGKEGPQFLDARG